MINEISILKYIVIGGAAGTVTLFIFAIYLYYVYELSSSNDDQWREDLPFGFLILKPFVVRFSAVIQRKKRYENRLKALKSKLAYAGLRYSIMPAEFIALKRLTAVLFLLISLFITAFVLQQSLANILLITIGLTLFGFVYPDIWVNDRTKARKKSIRKQFPYVLELLVLTMRAGLSFNAALEETARRLPEGEMRKELDAIKRDLRSGKTKIEAINKLNDRVDLPAIQNFVGAVVQADKSGGSITEVLSEQSERRRQERFHLAEEQAQKAPVKLMGPLLVLLFPITFAVLGFPIAIRFLDSGIGQ